MTVYAVTFNASNRATICTYFTNYEDFWQMDYFVGCFSSLEKAKEWIEKDIPEVISGKECNYNIYELIQLSDSSWTRDIMLKPEGDEDYYWECDYQYTIQKITTDIPVIEKAKNRQGW